MFTFSFSSAMAASTYYDDWNTALQAQKTVELTKLASYKATLLAKCDFNDMGYVKIDNYKFVPLEGTELNSDLSISGIDEDDLIYGYNKAAIEKAADAVIDDLTVAIDAAIAAQLNKTDGTLDSAPTTSAASQVVTAAMKLTVKGASDTAITELNFEEAVAGYTDELNKAQAALTRADIEKAADVDTTAYEGATTKYYYTEKTSEPKVGQISTTGSSTKLTAEEAVGVLKDDLTSALKDADDKTTNAEKKAAYEKAYAKFKYELKKIKTKADEEFDDITDITSLTGEVDNYAQYGYSVAAKLLTGFDTASTKLNWTKTGVAGEADYASEDGALKDFWSPSSSNSTTGKLFGVAIADTTKVTRAEAVEVYNAMKAEIDASKTVVTGWANNATGASKDTVAWLYKVDKTENETLFLKTLDAAMQAKDMYADVVTQGEKYKAEYRSGVKQYNDAKIEETVKNAADFVYADLAEVGNKTSGSTPNQNIEKKSAVVYIAVSANDLYELGETIDSSYSEDANVVKACIAELKEDAAKYGYENFTKAVSEAIEKILKADTTANYEGLKNAAGAGTAKGYVAKKVTYGADKTPEADLVYLLETYYGTEEFGDWKDIALDTVDALKDAQSYAEIDSIMAKAAEDFGKLLKDADQKNVSDARTAYGKALAGFIEQNYTLLGSAKQGEYSYAYIKAASSLDADSVDNCPLYKEGMDLINDANTVDEVKAAYVEAQALVTSAKSDDELKDMKKAVEAKITALPGVDKLTADDLAAVQEAYDALKEFYDLAGSKITGKTVVSNVTDLAKKYNQVIAKIREQIEDEAEALWDKMDAVNTNSDAGLAKFVAFKAEANALVDKVNDLNDEIGDVNDDAYLNTAASGSPATNELTEIAFSATDDYSKIKAATNLAIGNEGAIYDREVANAKRLLVEANKPAATADQLKAALDAYNALTERQQLELDQNNGYYYEIAKAIADKQNTAVKELKLKASSTAKKGSITVKWTVTGDATAIDGYEIWKSTKANKGYKKAFTTTKTSYKNTKDLKKGTRYYYKVRAYKMVDGVKVTSDWSNKAYRKAK